MADYWHDLSDSEIRARLENRGISPRIAFYAARHREETAWIEYIGRVLSR